MYPVMTIGDLVISSWWTALIAGAFFSVLLAVYLKPADFPVSRKEILAAAISLVAVSIIGARALFVILHWDAFRLSMYNVFSYRLGFAYFGALALSVLTLWIWAAARKKSFLEFLDYAAPFLMLSQVFVRIGCFAAGCCYGRKCAAPLGLIFNTADRMPRHATQLYEAGLLLFIFVSSRWFYYRIRNKAGCTAFFALALYGAGRFVVEAYRTDSPVLVPGLTLAQAVCLGIAVFSTLAFAVLYGRPRR